jgi:diketogulonate reductase-like aldo/keto reductase
MKRVALPCGESVPALGQGTWFMGEDPQQRRREVAALRHGLELGLALIDTAEMYAEGGAEEVVGEAIAGRRDEVFLVSKVYPHNASRRAMCRSCEASLRRLRVDTIDLYLLHWSGAVPLAETVEAFEALRSDGKIRHWGVSNLDAGQLQELWDTSGGRALQTDQVLYNLGRRGVEWDLLPWLAERRIPLMAYSPLEQARLLREPALAQFAQRHGRTTAQVALAWVLARDDVIAIPKSADAKRLDENAAALERPLTRDELAELDTLFPPPAGPEPLAML